jgi:predicted ester cyclase
MKPMEEPARYRRLILPLRQAMADFAEGPVRAALDSVLSPDAVVRLCHPFGTVAGAALYDHAYAPLLGAFPDLERRDEIVVAGRDADGAAWIGACGHYAGTFARPILDIPPTGHLAAFRFHEFFRVEGDRILEMQALWDLPELMMQAGAWPMSPELGARVRAFAPMTQDGLADHEAWGAEAVALVLDMLTHMSRHPSQGGPEVMELDRFWHPRFNWYGPAGIGTARGVRGFRAWHQIPFLRGMPDRGQSADGTSHHFFGEGAYAAVTGWPNMRLTLTGANWLGLPPTGQTLFLRSLDFWRIEGGRIRENWVLVDLLDAMAQVGVDPLARMREFNKARPGFDSDTGRAP